MLCSYLFNLINNQQINKKNICFYTTLLQKYITTKKIKINIKEHLHKKAYLTNLVDFNLNKNKNKINDLILESFIKIPREFFTNLENFNESLDDNPLHILKGQTMIGGETVIANIPKNSKKISSERDKIPKKVRNSSKVKTISKK